jgi:hypothetical protein
MKRKPSGSLLRWRDRQPGGEPHEDRAAALVRSAIVPGAMASGLCDQELAEVERNLNVSRPRGRRPSRGLRLALAGLLLLLGAASVMAYQAGWFAPSSGIRAPAPTQAPEPTAKRPAGHPASVLADDTAEPNLPAALPEEIAPIQTVRPRQARTGHRQSSGAAPASTSATSEEILALDHAVGLLRGKHDANAALHALDQYFARFPAGMLDREARVTRVDALLMLHRSDEALRALDALPLDAHGRSTELQLIRGELRSQADCIRAEADFAAVLARAEAAELVERALYGRGACRLKRGDTEGAAQDLRRYLARYPDGSHAGWARRWLETITKEKRP